MHFVRIQDGRVVEVIPPIDGVAIADRFHPDIVATLAETGNEVQEGWLYDGTSFVAPDAPEIPEPPAKREFSFLEFMDLFTEEEQLILVGASMTSPLIKLWYDKALGAQYISLDDARTEPGLQALVDASLISAERKAAVLAGIAPV